jgi:hypothetical protein
MANHDESKGANDASNKAYAEELGYRFEELMRWAIENWPDKRNPVSRSDFQDAFKAITRIRARLEPIAQNAPEPSEGGEQYVNVNPAPWP